MRLYFAKRKGLSQVVLFFIISAGFFYQANAWSKAVFSKEEFLSLALKDGMQVPRSLDARGMKLQWAEGGRSLLISTPAKNGKPAAIARMNPITGKSVLLAEGMSPVLSADGKMLGYTAPDGAIVIGKVQKRGLEKIAHISTRPKGGKGSTYVSPARFSFSPDGREVAYISYKTLQQREGLEGHPYAGMEATNPEIWIYTLADGKKRRVFTAPPADKPAAKFDIVNTQISNLVYGKDNRLFFTQGFGVRSTGMDTHIYVMDKEGKPALFAEDIVNHGVRVRVMGVNQTGRYLVSSFSSDPDFLNYGIIGERAVFDTETGQRTLFRSPLLGREASWTKDGLGLYFSCKPGAFAGTLCLGDVKTGEVEQITTLEPMAEITTLSVSPDGKQVAWVSRDRTDSIRIRVRDIKGKSAKTLWESKATDLTGKALGETRIIRWTSFDGLEIGGVLILPVNYKQGDKVPMIVDIHGGATGGVRIDGSLVNSSPLEHQVWAGKGYAVFLTDYRKGLVARHDIEVVRRIQGMSLHEGDAADVIAGIEHIIDMGIADPERIAAIGHSYGSTVLNQLITQSNILALAISKEGTHDYRGLQSLKGRDGNPAQYDTVMYTMRATPDTLQEWVVKSSPIVYADKVKTPLLLITAGCGVPEYQKNSADSFVNAINDTGGIAYSLFFPDDHHVITYEKNVRKMFDMTLDWIERYIGPGVKGQ